MVWKNILVMTLTVLLCLNIGGFSAGAPAVKVTAPSDGSVSLTRTVTVTGTSAGSDASWHHSTPEDFENGTGDHLAIAGAEVSQPKTYDDFNDNSFNADLWKKTEQNGLTITETGSELRLSGTAQTGTWKAVVAFTTVNNVVNFSADLKSLSGSGTGYTAWIYLYQDFNNRVIIGIDYDEGWSGNQQILWFAGSVSGTTWDTNLGAIPSGSHNLQLDYSGGTVSVFLDGELKTTKSMALQNLRGGLAARARLAGESVDARWDNVRYRHLGGSVSLTTVYDNFNDNSFDSAAWTKTEGNGLTVSESNRELRMSGTAQTGGWKSVDAFTTKNVMGYFSADLKALSGSGTGYSAWIYLYQDFNNRVIIGIDYDEGWSGTQQILWFAGSVSGTTWDTNLGVIPPGDHNFRLDYSAGTVSAYADGELKTTKTMTLQNIKGGLVARSRLAGETVDARWDNVQLDLAPAGNFTSAAFDTLSVDPVLKKVDWNATAPSGSATAVQVRSSDASDMTGATAWAALTNGQTASLPAVKRYLQFKAALSTSDGLNTPEFMDIRFAYHKPVKLVEVSIDNKTTWKPATGTGTWSITLDLPENSSTIWVRSTDVAGDTAVTSLRVEVDTTPPTGNVVIDDGAEFTTETEVQLALDAADAYGMASRIASEDPEFTGTGWESYIASAAFTLSEGDGPKTVYVKFRDVNGWESPVYNDSIVLDTLPPTGSIVVDGGAQYTRNATVGAALNASDPIGLDGMMVSTDPQFTGAAWADFTSIMQVPLAPGSGERTVYAKFRDRGGHVSQVYSDSILLDQAPPGVSLACNAGAVYTQQLNVSVTLTAADNYQVVSMQLGPGDGTAIIGMPWTNFTAQNNLMLPPGDGTKTISARLQDIAGNIGVANSTTIILDSTAPKTTMGAMASSSPKAKFNVSWGASDATSGVLWYDVQYKAGNGTWMDLNAHTNLTATQFTGEDLETYSFRARAQDRAGNLEEFPATVDNAITVRLPEPAVSIIKPVENGQIKGTFLVCGTCTPAPEGRTVSKVEWRVDNGTWAAADGTLKWSFQLDTKKLKDGAHSVQVRTYDGKHYSAVVERQIKVKNADPKTSTSADAGILLICGIGLALTLFARRRKS